MIIIHFFFLFVPEHLYFLLHDCMADNASLSSPQLWWKVKGKYAQDVHRTQCKRSVLLHKNHKTTGHAVMRACVCEREMSLAHKQCVKTIHASMFCLFLIVLVFIDNASLYNKNVKIFTREKFLAKYWCGNLNRYKLQKCSFPFTSSECLSEAQ